MKNLIANQPLSGDYGHVMPDESFTASDEVADSLVERGLARLGDDQPEADEDPESKVDEGAKGRKTKEDKTVTTENLQ